MTESGVHQDEYSESITDMLELIWGRGFFIPDGPATVRRIVEGLDLRDKTVLDIGSGIGGPALLLAKDYGAKVIGFEIEAPLVARARRYAAEDGLTERVDFRQVEVGPLALEDASVDVVYSSGVFIHSDDKEASFREVYRVLKPGGVLTFYDWMKGPGPLSEDMLYWFKMEELTFHMETIEDYGALLEASGFQDVTMTDDAQAYRDLARREYEAICGPLKDQMVEALDSEQQAHFTEDWRSMVVVLDKGELRPGYGRARKPL